MKSDLPVDYAELLANIKKRMLAFYREYADVNFLPQAVAKNPSSDATTKVPQPVALFTPELVEHE